MVYKTLANPINVKRKSYPVMVKLQMDCIVETLRRVRRLHFVHCLLPQSEPTGPGKSVDPDNALIDVGLLRSQLRGIQLLESVRLNKIGYPERMLFSEFRRRFECLAPADYKSPSALLDDRQGVQHLLEALEVDQHQYRVGLSQVFLRSDVLTQLEDARDDRLSTVVSQLQAFCRSWLVRRRLEKRRIQEVAIKCIQKNLNKYMAVKTWSWWKLYTRVYPLLDIHRTEEEMKCQAEEIETLRQKVEKLEKSHAELRLYCERLEARLSESQAELNEERGTAAQTLEALESENTERLRLQKDYSELKARHSALERKAQKLDLEVMEYRTLRSAMPEEDDAEDGLYKEKCSELKRQLETQKKQMSQEKKDEEEQNLETKRQLERKLTEAAKQMEELKEVTSTQRRKAQRATEEMQDLRIHLQQVTARNSDLEKKQRKFDMEVKSVKDEAAAERLQKEKFVREKEEGLAKIYRLEHQLRETRDELMEMEGQKRQVEADLTELSHTVTGSVAEGEAVQLKRLKLELEKKCVDQEEELDELAGQVQQLTATVTRLEMQTERTRQEHQKELEAKEQDVDEMRAQMQRRVRSLEQQLEDESEERLRLSRLNRDLDAKIRDSTYNNSFRNNGAEQELRRDIRKTKALLKDAQTLLQHYKDKAPNRGMIKQLKNQLEDAEFSRLSAIKGRQGLEADLEEMRRQLETAMATKDAAEQRCLQLMKERNSLQTQLEDHEEELQQLLKKYKAQVQQGSVDLITLNDQAQQISDLERDREELHEKVTELHSRVQWQESNTVDRHKLQLAENKIRDLEAKLDLEISSKIRFEASGSKAKELAEGLQAELTNLRAARDREQELNRRMQIQIQHTQEQMTQVQKRETEAAQKNQDLEAAMERAQHEHQVTLADLKLALRRIEDLQAALQEDLGLDSLDEEDEDDDEDLSDTEPVKQKLLDGARERRSSSSSRVRNLNNQRQNSQPAETLTA